MVMSDYRDLAKQLRSRPEDSLDRAEAIEDDLRHTLDDDWSEKAIDLADDEALESVDDVLRAKILQIRVALARIENGSYGASAKYGKVIPRERLEARPITTRCVDCA